MLERRRVGQPAHETTEHHRAIAVACRYTRVLLATARLRRLAVELTEVEYREDGEVYARWYIQTTEGRTLMVDSRGVVEVRQMFTPEQLTRAGSVRGAVMAQYTTDDVGVQWRTTKFTLDDRTWPTVAAALK